MLNVLPGPGVDVQLFGGGLHQGPLPEKVFDSSDLFFLCDIVMLESICLAKIPFSFN